MYVCYFKFLFLRHSWWNWSHLHIRVSVSRIKMLNFYTTVKDVFLKINGCFFLLNILQYLCWLFCIVFELACLLNLQSVFLHFFMIIITCICSFYRSICSHVFSRCICSTFNVKIHLIYIMEFRLDRNILLSPSKVDVWFLVENFLVYNFGLRTILISKSNFKHGAMWRLILE